MTEPARPAIKLLFMGVSLVLACFLWAYVKANQPLNARYFALAVQPFTPDGALPMNLDTGPLGQAHIEVTGPDDVLNTAVDDVTNKGMVGVFVDLTGAHVGTDEYPLRYTLARRDLPYRVTLLDKTLKLTIDQRVTIPMPITVEETGQIDPEKSLNFNGATAKPSVAKVSGPISAVRTVKKVRALLDLAMVDSSAVLPNRLEALDERDQPVSGVTVDPNTISLAVGVAPAPLTKSMLVEPVISGQPAMGYAVLEYSVEPNQVALQGPAEDLARISKVRTRPIVINDLRTTSSFEVPLDVPPNLKSYSVNRVRVRITIEAKATTGAANQPITVP